MSIEVCSAMTESQRFLQRMIVSTINARDVESNRVSRILHDEVGQVLSAVGLLLDVLKLDFRRPGPGYHGSCQRNPENA